MCFWGGHVVYTVYAVAKSASNIHVRLASLGGNVITLWKSISCRQVNVFEYGRHLPRLKRSQFDTLLMKGCGMPMIFRRHLA